MEKFTQHIGKPAVIHRNNIDTDQLIPKQFLKNILRTGYGISLFYDWRYDQNGKPNPDFILNQPAYQDATILITGSNFGSGSSREHAAWALIDFGFKSVIAESFGPIFYMNATKNGLLPIQLPKDQIAILATATSQDQIKIDLIQQTVTFKDHVFSFNFEEMYRYKFINGLDDIAITMTHEAEITDFEAKLPDFAAPMPGDMTKSAIIETSK